MPRPGKPAPFAVVSFGMGFVIFGARMHDISLITTIAFGLTAALFCGLLAKRIGVSPIVGYLVAGMIIGPHTPGFTGDVELAMQLAEIGVILLMFGVGLHFHIGDLLAVRRIAVPGALGQSAAATLCGALVAVGLGWTWNAGIVLGIAISVASTVVLIRVLTDAGVMETTEGRVAIGWLVVEDIITVIILVVLPVLATPASGKIDLKEVGWSAAIAMGKLAGLSALMAIVGVRVVPWLMTRVAGLRSRELFTLTVLVIAMAVATLGYLAFGASMALGAFLAGMVVAQSKLSHQAAADALPMRDAFAVLFFVSVGMLFDWRTLVEEPWLIAGTLAVILLVKPLVAVFIVLLGKNTLKTGLVVAGGLAQVGEFSFIVAEAAKQLGILPSPGYHAIVGSAIISISINPWLYGRYLRLENVVNRWPKLRAWIDQRAQDKGASANLREQKKVRGPVEAVIVGYGPVGRSIEHRVEEIGLAHVVVEMNVDTVLALQGQGKRALFGDATNSRILEAAGIRKATYLVVTLPEAGLAHAIVNAARALNPTIKCLVRARYLSDREQLEPVNPDAVCYDEAEAATALSVLLRAHARAEGFRSMRRTVSAEG
jgi:CPA2 family monovalent cation:H+ antiporter-2